MGYQNQPWTLNEKELKTRKNSYIKNRESDRAISTARVLKIFEENKNKKFTNRDIAIQLDISESTVSNITGKLRDLESIKQVGEIKPNRTIVYQHIDGPDSFKVMYNKIPTSQEIRNLFRNNTNKVYSSKLIAEETGYSSSIISSAIRVLLFNKTIKLVNIDEDIAQYQYRTGGKKIIEVYTTPNEEYCTVSKYIKDNNIKKIKSDDVLVELKSVQPRLFYSSHGVLKEYKKDKIAKIIDTLLNGSILKKMWNKVSL